MSGTAGTFWTIATPEVAEDDIYRAYLPVRLQGAAPDGSQDIFAQMLAPSAFDVTKAAVVAALDFMPVQQGTGPGQMPNVLAFGWDGTSRLLFSVDGNPSDYIPQVTTQINPLQPVFNIGPYQDDAVVKQVAGQHNTPGAFGYVGEGVPMGMGPIYVARHHLAYVATNVLSDGYTTSGGGSWALDGTTLHVGGPHHNTVVEGRSDLVVYDTVSPSCTNSNTVSHQVRAFITVDGTTQSSNMSMFGLASFVAGGPYANNFNLGNETDVGTTNNSAVFTRCGWNLNSIGSAKGPKPWYDAALLVTGGPQFASVQQLNHAGWRCGLAFSMVYGDQTVGVAEPISSDGTLIGAYGTVGGHKYAIAYGLDLRGIASFSGGVLVTNNMNIGDGSISLSATASTFQIGLGVTLTASTALLPSMVGFGKAPVGPSSVHSPGSGTDAVSVAVNDLRNCLINNGLAIAA